eukprot:266176-Lingulodinium_polyedra.AAC.1
MEDAVDDSSSCFLSKTPCLSPLLSTRGYPVKSVQRPSSEHAETKQALNASSKPAFPTNPASHKLSSLLQIQLLTT